MKKSILCLLLVVTTMLGLTACGAGGASSTAATSENTEKTYTIQLAGSVTEDHPITQSLHKFADLCNEYTDGRITVEVYPNCQLGSNREFYEQCQAGNIQMAEAGAVILANFTDKFKFMQLPYIFNSREAVQNFLGSDVGQQMNLDIAEETGIYPLVYFENGWQALTNSKKEIHTPEDLKGLKIRTQENDILLQIYTDLGASPMPMAFTELFTAMQQKTIDGQVNPALIAQTGRYYEVQKYISDVNAVYDLDCISINYDFYKSLPEDLQKAVVKAAQDARDYDLQLSADGETSAYKFLEQQGMVLTYLTDSERQEFKDAAAPVIDWFKGQNIESNLSKYLDKINECNTNYTDGKLAAVTGAELS